MSKQHHDIGWKKRQKNTRRPPYPENPGGSPDHLALQLVLNGLARQQILDYARRHELTARGA